MTYKALIERIPERYSGLRDELTTAFGVVARFEEKAKAINSDPTLSPLGRRDRLAEGRKNPAAHLAQLKTKNQAAIASIAARRKALEPEIKNRSDAVAEMRRAEIRTFLRGLSDAERTRMIFKADRSVIEAIADAPPALSGLTEDMHEQAVQAFIAVEHADAITSLAAEHAVLENARAALMVAEQALNRLAEPEERAA
jgi:hypothetical protein